MARVSRKTAIMGREPVSSVPEKIYHAAAYARLSAEDNHRTGNQDSIAMQKYMLEEYIRRQPDMVLYQTFCDNGETGTDFERPGFACMMDEIKKRSVDCIVVKDLSRFGRNYIEAGYYLEKIFPTLGVRFVAVNDQYDTKNSQNELACSVKNLVNDLYAKDISQKVESALMTKRRNGEFIGAFPPYGYLKSPEDKHKLVVDPQVSPIIREIFQWRLEGLGIASIARRLNDRKIPSPAVYHYEKGHKKRKPEGAGAIWQGQSIKAITSNPVYAGHMAQGKMKRSLSGQIPLTRTKPTEWIVVRNTHEAIIAQEVFDRVQKLTKERREKSCLNRGKYQTEENIFKGLLLYADCKTKMRRSKMVSPSGKARYAFFCRVYAENLGGQGCAGKYVKETELKEIVFHALRVQIECAVNLEKLLRDLQNQDGFQKKHKELSNEIETVQQKIKRNIFLRSSLFVSYHEHTLTEKEYLEMKEGYDQEAGELREALARLEAKKREDTEKILSGHSWITVLKKYQGEQWITRNMAVELIRCIYVSEHNKLEIVWNFQDEFARLAAETGGIGT